MISLAEARSESDQVPMSAAGLRVTVLGSGSAGNACLVEAEGCRILLDAGLSARRMTERLAACGRKLEELDGIVLTHEHGDHAQALKVWGTKGVPVYANSLTHEALKFEHGITVTERRVFSTGAIFAIGSVEFVSFSVPHDAADPVGFCLRSGEVRFAYLTDLGMVTQSVVQRVRGVRGVFLEANYDEGLLDRDTKRPWSVKQRIASRHGHLSNKAAAELIAQVVHDELSVVVLGHLSRDCNTAECATATLREQLGRSGHSKVTLHCAEQDCISPTFAFV